jgi:hypothetical protein
VRYTPRFGNRRRFFSLKDVLAEQRKFNTVLLSIAAAMVVVIFALGIFFALHYRNTPNMLEVALGGNLFSILITVSWTRKLWIEKGLVDLAYLATEQMPADEAIKLASAIYWRLLSGKDPEPTPDHRPGRGRRLRS